MGTLYIERVIRKKTMRHYVCDLQTGRVLYGPLSNIDVRKFINSLPENVQDRLVNLSRDMLSVMGVYPLGVVGDQAIRMDLKGHNWLKDEGII